MNAPQIERNKDLTSEHTFGVRWKSTFFSIVNTVKQVQDIVKARGNKNILVLGGGSNMLPTKIYKGIVVKNEIMGKDVVKQAKTFFDIRVGAGEDWHSLVGYTLRKKMFGLENLALIPGTVGGALVQNIGAYDVEISQFVKRVDTVDLRTGKVVSFTRDMLDLSYRHSIFKYSDRYCVTHVTLRLSKIFKPTLTYKPLAHLKNKKDLSAREVAREVIKIRRSKLPDWNVLGTAGSFFANPRVSPAVVKQLQKNNPEMPVFYNYGSKKATIPGGWLIEHSSLSPEDRIEFLYHKHALIVVNNRKGQTMPPNQGRRIKNFVNRVIKIVERDFNITLSPEVKIF